MDLQFTPQEQDFRSEVIAFLQENVPDSMVQKVASGRYLGKQEQEQWHAILNRKGWLAYHWPKTWGGPGWTAIEKFIFDTECALANAPRIAPFGVSMLGPVLIKYGSDAQKQYWLPRILNGDDWWCQGYSEPGSGSDLASLKTTAVRDGDFYVVNGQKTWTTLGQYANMIFCLVRTSKEGRPQEGISFLLIDMTAPGVEIRPIRMIEGGAEVNEVFFTDVRVPVANLVGQENQGWTYAKYLLTYERTGIAGVGVTMAAFERLRQLAARTLKNGKPLHADPFFAARMARLEIDLENMKTTNLRLVSAVAGGGVPGAESSMLKIRGSELRQEILSLIRRAVGVHAGVFLQDLALPLDDWPDGATTAAASYFNNRKLSIFGGSNEVQKNIISKMILGL